LPWRQCGQCTAKVTASPMRARRSVQALSGRASPHMDDQVEPRPTLGIPVHPYTIGLLLPIAMLIYDQKFSAPQAQGPCPRRNDLVSPWRTTRPAARRHSQYADGGIQRSPTPQAKFLMSGVQVRSRRRLAWSECCSGRSLQLLPCRFPVSSTPPRAGATVSVAGPYGKGRSSDCVTTRRLCCPGDDALPY
jgi:hypothetical protein